ncbi:MAG: PEFG-CTERM sorting domain-containing protein [Candidatus Nitrosopelagicus brevis]|nr:PEFG-CTERM sorting domain-containing protein [Candidatus Nitrosopelagicus brevis]
MKSKEVLILGIASLILLPFLGGESFAQSNQVLTVTTEKESYAAGEPIEVFGLVDIRLEGVEALIRVVSPVGNMVNVDQITVDTDGSFSKTISTSIGGLWKETGTYTIMVNYGENSTQVQFEYGGMMSAGVQATPEFAMEENEKMSQTIMIEDHSLDYELTCAEIQSMTPDTEMKSMIIAIKTDCDGELTITLPKDVIDTDENGFFVLVDGDETNHKASSVGEFWTLTIPFSYGSEEIEIIGTFVIPEFGTIAGLVLILAITSIIIISAKNKQIFIPKM